VGDITYKKRLSEGDCGYWECPECGSEFFGGGSAIHRKGCSKNGYEGLTYLYSQKEEDRWHEEVLERGFAANLPLSPNGLADYFLKRSISGGTITCGKVRQITEKYVMSINPKHLSGIMERLEELIAST
jgi:predicted  nucleic acid-binding Zn-ribbon protein